MFNRIRLIEVRCLSLAFPVTCWPGSSVTARLLGGGTLKRPCKLLSLFLGILLCNSAFASGPFSAIKLWTNEIGERFIGFESRCPKDKSERHSQDVATGRPCYTANGSVLSMTASNPKEMGLAADRMEEWLWIKEAMRLREKVMRENSLNLDQALRVIKHPEFPASTKARSYVDHVINNVIDLGEVEASLRRIQARLDSMTDSCSIGDAECTKQRQKELDAYAGKKRALLYAKDELLSQTPVLAHDNLLYWVKRVSEGDYSKIDLGSKDFKENFYEAVVDVQKAVQKRLDEYDRIKDDETVLGRILNGDNDRLSYKVGAKASDKAFTKDKYKSHIEEVTHDDQLLAELVSMVDPSMEKGLEGLKYAGCRLENRLNKSNAIGALRELGFYSALTVGTIWAGGVAARYFPWGAEAVGGAAFAGVDIPLLVHTRNQCEDLAKAAYAGAPVGKSNADAVRAYMDCREGLSNQVVMTMISAGTTGLGLALRSTKARWEIWDGKKSYLGKTVNIRVLEQESREIRPMGWFDGAVPSRVKRSREVTFKDPASKKVIKGYEPPLERGNISGIVVAESPDYIVLYEVDFLAKKGELPKIGSHFGNDRVFLVRKTGAPKSDVFGSKYVTRSSSGGRVIEGPALAEPDAKEILITDLPDQIPEEMKRNFVKDRRNLLDLQETGSHR